MEIEEIKQKSEWDLVIPRKLVKFTLSDKWLHPIYKKNVVHILLDASPTLRTALFKRWKCKPDVYSVSDNNILELMSLKWEPTYYCYSISKKYNNNRHATLLLIKSHIALDKCTALEYLSNDIKLIQPRNLSTSATVFEKAEVDEAGRLHIYPNINSELFVNDSTTIQNLINKNNESNKLNIQKI